MNQKVFYKDSDLHCLGLITNVDDELLNIEG
jgi:hypothetical protein